MRQAGPTTRHTLPLRSRRAVVDAVMEERRRMARELHDGLAQELAFISTETRRLARDPRPERLSALTAAADRALDESRAAIAALRVDGDEPFADALSREADQLAGRAGARVRLRVDPGVYVAPERRDHLLRIAREAVANGFRHGQATEVLLELARTGGPDPTSGDGLRLSVRDNGCGFEPAAGADAPRTGGFGLLGMRERVRALGGQLEVRSAPGGGTEVEVTLP